MLAKDVTIGHFNFSYAGLLRELRQCNAEYHKSSMYVTKLETLRYSAAYSISNILWMPDMQMSPG